MPSVELSKLQAVAAPRALSDSDRAQLAAPGTQAANAGAANRETRGVSIEVGTQVEASGPPVDNERVREIRQAIKEGRYPLIPTEIADAMIAARVSLGIGK